MNWPGNPWWISSSFMAGQDGPRGEDRDLVAGEDLRDWLALAERSTHPGFDGPTRDTGKAA